MVDAAVPKLGPRDPYKARKQMVEEAKLVTGVITIMRGHLTPFSSDISDDQLRPIARSLVKMICRSEPKRALDQYVGSELIQLSIEPNPYDKIVDEAYMLMSNLVRDATTNA
jgi:hypothetical protein